MATSRRLMIGVILASVWILDCAAITTRDSEFPLRTDELVFCVNKAQDGSAFLANDAWIECRSTAIHAGRSCWSLDAMLAKGALENGSSSLRVHPTLGDLRLTHIARVESPSPYDLYWIGVATHTPSPSSVAIQYSSGCGWTTYNLSYFEPSHVRSEHSNRLAED